MNRMLVIVFAAAAALAGCAEDPKPAPRFAAAPMMATKTPLCISM